MKNIDELEEKLKRTYKEQNNVLGPRLVEFVEIDSRIIPFQELRTMFPDGRRYIGLLRQWTRQDVGDLCSEVKQLNKRRYDLCNLNNILSTQLVREMKSWRYWILEYGEEPVDISPAGWGLTGGCVSKEYYNPITNNSFQLEYDNGHLKFHKRRK